MLPLTFHKHHDRLPTRLAEAVVAGASVRATVLPKQHAAVTYGKNKEKDDSEGFLILPLVFTLFSVLLVANTCPIHRAPTPSTPPLRMAKTGKNHLNEEITPLLPTGI